MNVTEAKRREPSAPALLDLLVALGFHVVAFPAWFVQAAVWNTMPSQNPGDERSTELFIAWFAGTLGCVYLALFGVLVIWWRQGRKDVFWAPILWGVLVLFPCLAFVLVARPVRRAFVPPRPDGSNADGTPAVTSR